MARTVRVLSLAMHVRLVLDQRGRGNVEGEEVGLCYDLEPSGSFRCFRQDCYRVHTQPGHPRVLEMRLTNDSSVRAISNPSCSAASAAARSPCHAKPSARNAKPYGRPSWVDFVTPSRRRAMA